MRILGIDPGVATVGFGVIDSEGGRQRMVRYGAITTPAGMPLAARLVQIGGDLEQLIRQFQPDEMSIEELFFSKNITTGIAVAHGRGVLLYTAEKMHLPVYEYTPMQIKQALTGYGRADKKQIQQVVTSLLRLKSVPRPDDAADALAIALCHAFTSRFGALFSVENSTRTKGKNAVTGSYFKSAMDLEKLRSRREE